MLKVGLTGGTGAGKSTVASRLVDHGAIVIDADRLAREVIAPGTEGLCAVVEEFGAGVLSGDGALDRPALAALVFADPVRRSALEKITHPRIAALTDKMMLNAPDDRVVVHDVPLLVEKHMGAAYHLVVVADAPPAVRVRRLVRSRGMSEDDARARVRAQASDVERHAAADVVLDNSGPPEVLLGAVDELWFGRLVPFERSLREGEPAPRAPLVGLVAPDPTWSAQAQRLIERVRLAAGRWPLGVEHIGSTAVPGLAGKDVIDLQLRVPSLSVADELEPAVRDVGYARMAGQWWDDEPAGTAPKRVFCSCDPGRAVNLHVRAPGWTARMTLLFRDWLRAQDDERAAYGQVKADLQGRPVNAYAEAKGPWIRAACERAEAWGRSTGWTLDG